MRYPFAVQINKHVRNVFAEVQKTGLMWGLLFISTNYDSAGIVLGIRRFSSTKWIVAYTWPTRQPSIIADVRDNTQGIILMQYAQHQLKQSIYRDLMIRTKIISFSNDNDNVFLNDSPLRSKEKEF